MLESSDIHVSIVQNMPSSFHQKLTSSFYCSWKIAYLTLNNNRSPTRSHNK